MNQHHIKELLQSTIKIGGYDVDPYDFEAIYFQERVYSNEELQVFIRDLNEAGEQIDFMFLQHEVRKSSFWKYINELELPFIVFYKDKDETILPAIIFKERQKEPRIRYYDDQANIIIEEVLEYKVLNTLLDNEDNQVFFLTHLENQELMPFEKNDMNAGEKMTPSKRLFRLFAAEKKEIYYIYIYAVIIGLISLSLPLGIQAVVGLVRGGLLFSTVIFIIIFIILGILITGGLQIMQLTLVEILQRRIFAKAAFEFTFRVPRLKTERILNNHVPELMNRFFDVLTIQKGLPKILIEFSAGIIQILFGLLLLAFYHPFFIFFGVTLVLILIIIFYFTGPKGLKSNITESKYKYKIVYWLEELARSVDTFKLAGNSPLATKKTDHNLNNYLTYRKIHFRVLVSQYTFIVLFKTLVTGGLLLIGTLLVIDRQITLGQFVASEIVIILILNSVEKLITYMDVIYDLLTAVDKISHVTDLPLEKLGGMSFNPIADANPGMGLNVKVRNLGYRYDNSERPVLKNLNFEVKAGEAVCFTGYNGSGRSTFLNILAGVFNDYTGTMSINDISMRDIEVNSLRNYISKNTSSEDIFDGTIYENISLGKPEVSRDNILWAVENVGLTDYINNLPEGLNTHMQSGGKSLSATAVNKLILARCIAQRPRLLILNDFFQNFHRSEKDEIIRFLVQKENPWTLIVVSEDPVVLKRCNRIFFWENGMVTKDLTYEEILQDPIFRSMNMIDKE